MDQDPIGGPDNDAGTDACITLYFTVPPVPGAADKSGGGKSGWGSLVLHFTVPIDGGSFIFDPDCPTTTQGLLNTAAVTSGIDGTSLAPFTMIQLTPLTSTGAPQAYALPQTGTLNANDEPYQQFVVTIMYDTVDAQGRPLPVPAVDPTQSFWQSKSKRTTTPFTYVPPGTKNADLALPEPSFWFPILVSLALAIFVPRRTRQT